MKKNSLLILLSILSISICNADKLEHFGKKAQVGLQPMAIIPEGHDILHVICLGKDYNFNNEFDEDNGEGKPSDELPSWWKISNITNAHPAAPNEDLLVEKVMDLNTNWNGIFPYRCKSSNIIYIPQAKYILSYDMSTAAFIDTVKIAGCKAISSDNGRLYISVREYDESGYVSIANYVVRYDVAEKTVIDTIQTGYNVQQTIPYHNLLTSRNMLAVLCEGTGTKDDSYIEFYDLESKEQVGNFLIGNTGNYMNLVQLTSGQVTEQIILAVVNASHKVQAINAQTYSDDIPLLEAFQISTEFKLPTADYNGPREIAGNTSGKLYVTAYDGSIYVIDAFQNQLDTLNAGGVPEGIYAAEVSPSYLNFAYANIYDVVGAYTPGNEVYLEYHPKNSIPIATSRALSVFPNPAKDDVIISSACETLSGIISIYLADMRGNTLHDLPFMQTGSSISFSLPDDISAGAYLVIIETITGKNIIKLSKE